MKDWIIGLIMATVGCIAGAVHFSDLANAPAASSPVFQMCSTYSDPATCYEAEYPVYQKINHDEQHWATVLTVLAVISGFALFFSLLVAKQQYVDKRRDNHMIED